MATAAGDAIGMIEMTSVGMGHLVTDAMLKSANVKLLVGRTICSGKYISIVGGGVSAVQAAVSAGLSTATDGVIDHIMIPNIHKQVFAALGDSVQLTVNAGGDTPALGIIETFSAASALEAADAAVKSANITLFRIHVAMALGGKGLVMMAGNVADVRNAVETGSDLVKAKGLLVSKIVIPRPARELFGERL